MHTPQSTIAEQILQQLARCVALEIVQVQAEYGESSLSRSLFKVSVLEAGQNEYTFVLKRQQDDGGYRFYQQYLRPYRLDSPQVYGCIELDGQCFWVMEYIPHLPPDWNASPGYLKAVQWLIQKDRITLQNLNAIRKLDCLGTMEFYGVAYWLAIFEKWHKDSTANQQAQVVWARVNANQNRINDCIAELNQTGLQTVVHGDLHMSNILFRQDNNELFVIDWTQPHISSVTKDLASLYDNAPLNVKSELIKMYRTQIDFHNFEETFAKAKILRDVGYLSWMAEMINEGQGAEIAQTELDRVAKSLLLALE